MARKPSDKSLSVFSLLSRNITTELAKRHGDLLPHRTPIGAVFPVNPLSCEVHDEKIDVRWKEVIEVKT